MLKSQWLNHLNTLFFRPRNERKRGLRNHRAGIEQLEDRALLATQVITPTPVTQAVVPGNNFSIDVDYSTLDDSGQPGQEQATALGLRLHYDSSVMTFVNLTNVFSSGLTATADQADVANNDGDASTDRYINAAWFDFGGNWPGTSNSQPLRIYTANFTSSGGFTGTTTLNFTRSTTPAGFPDFQSTSPTVTEFITPDVSISDAADVTEGGVSVFTVTLDQNPSAPVTVGYSTANDTTDASDFTALTNQTLTFNPGGALTQQINVQTTQDGTVEPDESFFVNLTSITNGILVDNQGTGTILNDDVPEVSVADAGTVNEGDSATFVVSLDQAPLADVTVTLSTADGTAVEPGDYVAVSGQVLTFSPGGALTQQVVVATNDDTISEADEAFTLEIDSAVGGTESVANGSGSVTIAANDPPTVHIGDAGSVSEGGIANFVVFLDQSPGLTLTVDYTATAGTAADVDDFNTTSGTLTFTPTGSLTQAISVPTVQDGLVEQDEDFTVDLSNPVNVILGSASGSATILDDDVPAISVSDAPAVAEGADAVFTVSLDQAPVSPVTVTVNTSNGSSTDPDDYVAVAGLTLTFLPSDPLTQEVRVTTVDDSILEFDEDFFLDLSSPVGGTIADNQGQAIITSDDVPVVSVADASSVAEGMVSTFVISLDNLPLTGQDLMVDITTMDGTALDGADYAGGSSTLTFTSSGPLTQGVSVTTINDSLVEPDETFFVELSNPINGTIGNGHGVGTIISDDVPSASVSDAATVAEGTDAVFTVSLDQAPLSTVSIDVSTTDDTAVSPDDFTALTTQTLTFTPTGPLTQTVSVTTIDDSLVEPDESFFLDLIGASGATISDSQGQGTITSSDVPTVSIADSLDTPEGQAAAFAVSVDQSPLPGQDLTVDLLSASGTADDGVDYQSLNITLTFSSNSPQTAVVLIGTTQDSLVELDEDFVVDLSSVTNGTIGVSQGQAVILDDDLPTVSIDDVTVDEGTDAVFTISLDQAPVADVTVSLSTSDDTAVSPDDFTPVSDAVVTFSPGGALTQQVSVTTVDDSLVEAEESFLIDITDLTGGTVGDGQGQATINSEDVPSISISDAIDVNEGTDAVFTVSLDQAPLLGSPVTVDVATGNGAADSSDYTAVSQTLVFTSVDPLTRQVTVSTTDDALVEVSEDFVVDLSSPAGGTIADGQGTGLILDNDLPTVSIDDVSIDEGQDVVFTVSLDQAPVSSLSFTYSTSDGTAVAPDDYTAVTDQVVTFDPGGPLTQTVSVSTVDDSMLEQDEDFTVDLENASNVNIGDGQGVGTILTNDGPAISISDAAAVDEGQPALFTVSLDQSPLPGQDVVVDLTTVDGTATAGEDFTPRSLTLTFTATDPLTQQIAIQTTDDAVVEPTEDFTVQIGNPVNGTIADGIGDGRIFSDDFPTLSISDAAAVDEGQDAVFTVSLDQAPVSTVTVTLSTADGTASAPDDYTEISNQSLTFNPGGSISQDITVSTIDDELEENAETFFFNILSATGATISDVQGSGTINAGDAAPVLDTIPRFPNSKQPTITWQAAPGASDYEIWVARRFPMESRILESVSIVTGTSFTPPADLDPGFYKIWVRQVGGAWSNEQTFEIVPSLLNPINRTFSSRPTFQWPAIPNAPGHEIFIRTTTGDIRVTDIPGQSFTPLVDLSDGPVRWWIRSSDAIGNRGWSELGQVTVQSAVTAPVGSTSDTMPTITWDAVDGAGRYILHVLNLDTNTVVIREDNLSGTSYTPTTNLSGNYRIWVKAINAATNMFSDGRWSQSSDVTVAEASPVAPPPQLVSLSSLDDAHEADSNGERSRRVEPRAVADAAVQDDSVSRSDDHRADVAAPGRAENASNAIPPSEVSELDELMSNPEAIADLMTVG